MSMAGVHGRLDGPPRHAGGVLPRPGTFDSPKLPTGGGAIRGIGEKFGGNPATGAGNVVIPLPVSAGRSGFGPSLSLSYDSGSGNGPFGFGWSLSLESISRRTDRGVPRYLDADDSDRFALTGLDDLVPALRELPDGRWVKVEREVDGYLVRRYRARTEGAFIRIERWTRLSGSGDVHWRTITRDNILSIFGGDAGSRIADPLDPQRIHSWLLSETRDDKGNAIRYRYRAEDGSVRLQPGESDPYVSAHERSRGSATDRQRAAQRYLHRVLYGNVRPLLLPDGRRPRVLDELDEPPTDDPSEWLFEIRFDYGELDGDDPTGAPESVWLYRPDAFSTFKPGFELRTSRRCERILMFHHVPHVPAAGQVAGMTGYDGPVQSLTFGYETSSGESPDPGGGYSFLKSVVRSGWKREHGVSSRVDMPALEFEYSRAIVRDDAQVPREVGLLQLPTGLGTSRVRWVDLHGEGLPGILSAEAGAWSYRRNLGPADGREVRHGARPVARFGPPETLPSVPALAAMSGVEFLDLNGTGAVDVVVLDGDVSGLHPHDDAEGWEPFREFQSRPNRRVLASDARFIDLDGDGRPDLLVTEDDALLWHRSLGDAGFGGAIRIAKALDEDRGPRVLFSEEGQGIHLADFNGDGLTDIVRVRNGEVAYWPNMGHGRFGPKVVMDNPPWFEEADKFDSNRVRLADIDGSGTVDIVYLHGDGVRLYFNQSGNRWSDARPVEVFPRVDDLVSVQVLDLLGTGTACLVWSSDAPTDFGRHVRYVELMSAGKPHLLVRSINNMGAESLFEYGPSTGHYLRDKIAGRPWSTRLPFPVHVLERIESIDHVTKTRFVSRFAYHHGLYDAEEREFCGFGMVEQFDTESFEGDDATASEVGRGDQDRSAGSRQPPVVTRTWYHTGTRLAGRDPVHPFSDEYHGAKTALGSLEASDDAGRPSLRSLRGTAVRQETYGEDGSRLAGIPYVVSESKVEVRRVQPASETSPAVQFAAVRETVTITHERDVEDARVAHTLRLKIDEMGNDRQTCSIVYGRRSVDEALVREVAQAQARHQVVLVETDYTSDVDLDGRVDAYRPRVPCSVMVHEVTGLLPRSGLFDRDALQERLTTSTTIGFEIAPDRETCQRRLLSSERTLFAGDDLNPLPLGELASLGLVHRGLRLALTAGILTDHLDGRVHAEELRSAGYEQVAGDPHWWVSTGTAVYEERPHESFYCPVGYRDALGVETRVVRDPFHLLVQRTSSPAAPWNVSMFENDYRLLVPVVAEDPNGNRRAVVHDVLGLVVATAVMGKAGTTEGDSLAEPGTRTEYALFNWQRHGKPVSVRTLAREVRGDPSSTWKEHFAHLSGSGSVALTKSRASPGRAFVIGDDGRTEERVVDVRWIGEGRTVVDNKGNPIRQYEPYFSDNHAYDDARSLRESGVSPVLTYDPLGRLVGTLFPDGTSSKVRFTPWKQESYDRNDTVLGSRWYEERGSPDPERTSEPRDDPERRAAWLTAKHASTPTTVHFDAAGRPVSTESDHGGGRTSSVRVEGGLGPRTSIFDQLGRAVAETFTGPLGQLVSSYTAEKGRRWTFCDALGMEIKSWDELGRSTRFTRDGLHRPVSSLVRDRDEPEIVRAHVVYGDRLEHGHARKNNLLGAAHLSFDQGGMIHVPALDFEGNPSSIERRLTSEFRDDIDWSSLLIPPDVPGIQDAADLLLDREVFRSSAVLDALGRPVRVELPDGTHLLPRYGVDDRLQSLRARVRGRGDVIEFLKGQEHDAHGRRVLARFGNDVVTRCFYDPRSFRLSRLLTHSSESTPNGGPLQDLRYFHDPVGNVTEISDAAQPVRYFAGASVDPGVTYEYDASYQLVRASGRESAGGLNDRARTAIDLALVALSSPGNPSAVRRYTEEYDYDTLGNLRSVKHRYAAQAGGGGGWTRHCIYAYDETEARPTNRIVATASSLDEPPSSRERYEHDVYGNMTRMPHLESLEWNVEDQLRKVDLGGGGTVHHVYAAGGQRLRKVVERNGDLVLEWIYLGPVTIFRRRRRSRREPTFERTTLHVRDGSGVIARVDTKTVDDGGDDPENGIGEPLVRYQHSNALGTAVLETDAEGGSVSYEEFHPYGTTAYRAARRPSDGSLKRYRFCGKERDDETGLDYSGARYYAPWLGRWASSDPAGMVDGLNLYRYCRNNPTTNVDPSGTRTEESDVIVHKLVRYTEPMTFEQLRAVPPEPGYKFDPEITEENFRDYLRQDVWTVFVEDGRGNGGSGQNGSLGFSAAAPGLIKHNPTGPTIGLPEGMSAESINAIRERIVTDRGVAMRSKPPGGGSRTADLRSQSRSMAKKYNASLAPSQRAGALTGLDVDHLVPLQLIGRDTGTAGANSVRVQDHAARPTGQNRSEGPKLRHALEKQVAAGLPEDVAAGGVAPMSELGQLRHSQTLRSVVRWAGYALQAAGPVMSAVAASGVDQSQVRGAAYGAAAMEGGGALVYGVSRFGLGGALGAARGLAGMAIGAGIAGVAGGVGQAVMSGYMAYQDWQRGDVRALVFDALAAVGGVVLILGAIGFVATGWVVAAVGAGLAAGVFHAGRSFGWWR